MKKTAKLLVVILSILLLIVVIWIASVFSLFTGTNSSVPKPIYSVDGSRVIIPSVDYNKDNQDAYLLVHLEVQDTKSGKTLFQVQTRASDRMRWSVSWVDNSIVKIDSSDVGIY